MGKVLHNQQRFIEKHLFDPAVIQAMGITVFVSIAIVPVKSSQ
jgi:hypothetical protein